MSKKWAVAVAKMVNVERIAVRYQIKILKVGRVALKIRDAREIKPKSNVKFTDNQ